MKSSDPLLQPFTLKHLTLKNRIISTSHEPAYSEEGLPKTRYRLYHEEKSQGRPRAHYVRWGHLSGTRRGPGVWEFVRWR